MSHDDTNFKAKYPGDLKPGNPEQEADALENLIGFMNDTGRAECHRLDTASMVLEGVILRLRGIDPAEIIAQQTDTKKENHDRENTSAHRID